MKRAIESGLDAIRLICKNKMKMKKMATNKGIEQYLQYKNKYVLLYKFNLYK